MWAEGIDKRYVGRVTTARDDDPAYWRRVVARIERVPCAVQEDLHPGAEIHGINDRDADVTEMAVCVACRNVEAAAESKSQAGEVATDTDALVKSLEGCPRRQRRSVETSQ